MTKLEKLLKDKQKREQAFLNAPRDNSTTRGNAWRDYVEASDTYWKEWRKVYKREDVREYK